MGIYVIWKFAKNKEAAKQFLVDMQIDYRQHFLNSKFYNFPAWPNAVKGGFKTIRKMAQRQAQAARQVHRSSTTIAQKLHDERRLPGLLERRHRGDLQHVR